MTDFDLTVTHLVAVTDDQSGPGSVFRGECSCGWTGDRHDDQALAELDGDEHRMVAVDPADGLDVTISGLLDLQDDLARAVMWLAEHWSADLPVPEARGHGVGGARVELSAYCPTTDVLSRAAARLGVPLVDDPAPDACGHCYQRATRTFGGVRIVVLRTLDHDRKAAA